MLRQADRWAGQMSVGVVGRAVVATMAIALAVGCSGSDGGGGSGSDSATGLVDRLPEDVGQVAAIDVTEVRERLGLPDDQGIDDLSDDDAQQLAFVLGSALPFVAMPRTSPIRDALDLGAVTAVASAPYAYAPDRAAVVVRTSQTFEDVAEALEDQGYERDGDLLTTDLRAMETGGVTVVAAAGDDLIVLAQSTEVAQAVADGDGDGPALAEALDGVDGPLRAALAAPADSASCVDTVAVGWQVDPAEGEIAVTVADAGDADGLELLPGDGPIARAVDLDPPRVDGRTLRARYRYDGPGSPVTFLYSELPVGDGFLRCP